ncbi:signal peptidase II [Cohnella terricola]|uniref:Lipoprotein signal peptidase n=1 Tax=Cohnella terricola TaxID=1289167 RepID=A0A559JA17_9BACL|nr:signal peptidase II [Cohnella terricola]TVX96704.1 signal peptidase II [Cohnella terricola]
MYFYLIIVAAIIVDVASKIAIRLNLDFEEQTEILGGLFRLVHLANTGSTGNMFHGWGRVLAVFVIVLTVAALYWHRKGKIRGAYVQTAVALIIGGALGNAIDRLAFNQVTDFLFFSAAATMNFADIWVFAGILMLTARTIYRTIRPAAQGNDASS